MSAAHLDTQFTLSSGNVFADMGLADADELLARTQLGSLVRQVILTRGLSQYDAGMLLGLKQPEVSRLMNGRYHLFSEQRLFGFLNRLNHKIMIQVSPHHAGEPLVAVSSIMN
jgi:predicted XRE-type DNA-binding protein